MLINHVTKTMQVIPIHQMEDGHLLNTIKMHLRKAEKTSGVFAAKEIRIMYPYLAEAFLRNFGDDANDIRARLRAVVERIEHDREAVARIGVILDNLWGDASAVDTY